MLRFRRLSWPVGASLALCAGLAARALGGGAPDTTRSAGPENVPLRHQMRPIELAEGERLVYEIKWSGMPAGASTLSVKWKRDFEGSQAYHVECQTKANKLTGFAYPVDDKTITIIDAAGGFSRLFQMSKNEARIRKTEHIRFDYENDLAVYEQRRPGPFPTRSRKRVHIDGLMQDPLSCVYYLRATPLSPGDKLRMPVHTERRTWPLTVEVVRREEIDVPGFGTLSTLRLEPTMHFPGIFVRKGRMVIWVEEETRIPVRMNVDVPVGSVTVTLSDAENAPLARIGAETAAEKPPKAEAPKPDTTEAPDKLPAAPKVPDARKPLEGNKPETE
ncbi:MAG: DUF3108 domain-containing protein [Planctomycetota bacterium]